MKANSVTPATHVDASKKQAPPPSGPSTRTGITKPAIAKGDDGDEAARVELMRQTMRGHLDAAKALQAEQQSAAADEEDEGDTLPEDVFSLIFVNPPLSVGFALALGTFSFQIICLYYIWLDMMDYAPGSPTLNAPQQVSATVRVAQALALLIAVATADDIITALNEVFDAALIARAPVARVQCYLSCLCRFAEGAVGLLVCTVIIIQSSGVIDLFANFAAMGFISCMDDVVFALAKHGYLSKSLQRAAEETAAFKVPASSAAGSARRRTFLLLAILGGVAGLWATISVDQLEGAFLCTSMSAQFGDGVIGDVGFHSGGYDILTDAATGQIQFAADRAVYVERNQGYGTFAFCAQSGHWTFTVAPDMDVADWPCRDLKLRSPKTSAFDLAFAPGAEWSIFSPSLGLVPAPFFMLSCNACANDGNGDSAADCNFNGRCNADTGRCECSASGPGSGRFGPKCEFPAPASVLVTEIGKGPPLFCSSHG